MANVLEYIVVAAVDFGTTFFGYAFALKGEDKILVNPNWGAYQGGLSCKTPTTLLLAAGGNFEGFGFAAEDKYLRSEDDEELHLYHQFKMLLHSQEKISRETQVKSTDGTYEYALTVFSTMLREMKKELLQSIEKHSRTTGEDDIRWVVTVPAIWTDDSKRFMREAAFQAGITRDLRSPQLMIALEPEAGALYCHSLDASNFSVETTDQNLTMDPGTKYLVIDCGGGTVDIAAHQVLESGHLKELYFPTGGAWGGCNVNKKFEDLLAAAVDTSVIARFKSSHHRQWWSLMRDYEVKKRFFNGEKGIRLSIPYALGEVCREVAHCTIDEAIGNCDIAGITIKQGLIDISALVCKSLFDDMISAIIGHVEELLTDDRLADVNKILMVGGFSESPYLQKHMLERFPGKVLIPQDASIAVMKGAVRFGLEPYLIESRVAARSYGTRIHSTFKPGVHPESKLEVIEGKEKCKDIFSVFVTKGSSMPMGEVKEFTYYPLYSDQTAVTFRLYSCDRDDVMFTDEEGWFRSTRSRCKCLIQQEEQAGKLLWR